MKILIFESNLMWSSRLGQTCRGLGHECEVRTVLPPAAEEAKVAIVNLGEGPIPPADLIPHLQSLGLVCIGHAGHKEKELHALGKAVGCDVLATNRELTYQLDRLLEQAILLVRFKTENKNGGGAVG